MQKIVTFLWFNGQAEEATRFYTSVFPNSRLLQTMMAPPGTPGMNGGVLGTTFELEGVQFMALNGGPQYQFNPAISLYVNCADQQEVDDLWNKLTADGGKEIQCGWLVDKYGVSWQIVPTVLNDLLQSKDPEKAMKTMRAMLGMQKLIIADLQAAHDA